ncbi:MAG: LamG domain-containing protein [Bacteroidota bacterium]|nr:LamG domain-containing protein [Bacteroidota bacterium]
MKSFFVCLMVFAFILTNAQTKMYINKTTGGTDSIALSEIKGISFKTHYVLIPTEGLLAWYPFNGNANDSSGNMKNGVLNNVILALDRFNHPNNSYSFDGSSSFIDCGQLHPAGTTTYSISFWLKVGRFKSIGGFGGNNGILTDAGGNVGTWFYQNDSLIYFQQQGNGAATTKFSLSRVDTLQWIHLVGVYKQGSMSFYKNSNLVDSLTQVISTPSTGYKNFQFGRDVNLSTGYWKGLIDDIRIYNKELTLDEINALYHEGGW